MPDQTDQRTSEWLADPDADDAARAYHTRQFEEPYRSTVHFVKWLDSLGLFSLPAGAAILDVGTGQGANVLYMARRRPNLIFTGIDLNPQCVDRGNAYFRNVGQANCQLEQGDLYALDAYRGRFAGITSFQTLSWLPNIEDALAHMVGLGATWIAATSLFYEGDVSCAIGVNDYGRGKPEAPYQSHYNVYSIPRTRAFFAAHGYPRFESAPFHIDVDLPRPASAAMGTFTERLGDGRRLQISGPLLMPWHFIVATR